MEQNHQLLFEHASWQTKNVYAQLKTVFLTNAMDFEDVMQEINIKVLEVIKIYGKEPLDELLKISGRTVRNRLKDLVCQSLRYAKYFINVNHLLEEIGIAEEEMIDIFNHGILKNSAHNSIQFKDLLLICNDFEFDILRKKLYEQQTNRDIAKEYGYTGARIGQIYKSILNKIRKYIIDKEE